MESSLYSVFFFSVVKKVAQYMADVLEDSRDKVQENLLANGGNNSVVSLFTKLQASRSFVC